MLPLTRDIAKEVQPDLVADLETPYSSAWNDYGYLEGGWSPVLRAAETLVGVLKLWRVRERILGPSGPALAAEGLHRGSGTRPLTFGMTGTTSTPSTERPRR